MPDEGDRTFEEWRITGQPDHPLPGHRLPPYDFVWAPWNSPDKDPEKAARGFVEKIVSRGGWLDGPHLSRRTVTLTAWETVEHIVEGEIVIDGHADGPAADMAARVNERW